MKEARNCRQHVNRIFKRLLLLYALFFLTTCQVSATHSAGADLTYKCLGGLTYQLDLTFYRDCGGISEPGNVIVTYKSASCNYNFSAVANKLPNDNGLEITSPCASAATTCNGGIITGLRKWTYRAVVTLPSACADWVFSYRVCCRNCSITTIQNPCGTGSEIYVEAKLNNIIAPGNSSPKFSNVPIAFVCLGQNFNYNQGVFDIDGDSLSYELITPKISATSTVTWMAPATTQAPLASSTPFSLNALTGDINFTPSSIQIGVLAVRVNEFRNGQQIGSTIRDMQVYVQNCSNSIPVLSGLNGSSNYITSVCPGQSTCFTMSAADPDTNQVVTLIANNPIPNAIVTQTSGSRPTLQFCWTPTASDIRTTPYTFTVTVMDNACPTNGIQTFSYSILVSGLTLNTTSSGQSCVGLNNGTATAIPSPSGNYTYSWNTNPPQNTATATGLAPGNYVVTVTDSGGCSAQSNVTITQSQNSLSGSLNIVSTPTCASGNGGAINFTTTGGTSPFTYQWSNGLTAQNISGLAAGTYSVSVTDANGCSFTDSVTIAPSVGSVIINLTAIQPTACTTGAVNLSTGGGVGPYSYLWNTGTTTQNLSNVQPGIYTVTVTDANGCSSNSSTQLIAQAPIQSTILNSIDVNCFGGNDGSLSINVSGGAAPYSYLWSNGLITPNINSLSAGNYVVTVTDANGCTGIFNYSVSQPLYPLAPVISGIQNISCFGDETGSIQVTAGGGTLPYSYQWSSGQQVASASNLAAGTYTVTVTDAKGCSASANGSINEPLSPLIASVSSISNNRCYNSNDGSINLSVNGGTLPYSYLWNTGNTSQNPGSLPNGIYTVTVTDKNGCTSSVTATVSGPSDPLSALISNQQNVLCFHGNNGGINLSVSGGVTPYTFNWNTGATTEDLSMLTAGTYSVQITDANGCTTATSVTITEPSTPLMLTVSSSHQNPCSGVNDGSLQVSVSGGSTPYSYLWNTGATSGSINNLPSGIYTVTVTDANGCNAIISDSVKAVSTALNTSIIINSQINCAGTSTGSLAIQVNGGAAPYQYSWSNGATTTALNNLSAGNYSVIITDQNGCTSTQQVTLTEPSNPLIVTGSISPANCLAGTYGSINLNVTGGSPGYNYLWNTGITTQNLTQLAAGNFAVSVTDQNGCSSQVNFEIPDLSGVTIQTNGSLSICAGETVSLIVDSFPNCAYQWYYNGVPLNGATSNIFNTPAAGVYMVSVTNSCGNFISNQVEVVVRSVENVTVSNNQIICPPQTVQLNASGGASYLWSPATFISSINIPNPVAYPQQTTNYSVQITDAQGCKTSLDVMIGVMCDSLLIPNGFSPNSDGTNDGFVIDGIEKYPGNKLWVYNRWGNLVYKAKGYDNKWDGFSNISGTSNGAKLQTGTYFYILDLNNGSKPKSGYLILRR